MFDIIIRGGRVVDGNGMPAFSADVGIKDGKITAVDDLTDISAKIIDATGLLIAPGFIDMHSHSDIALLANPRAESKIRQGVTTEVIGNCGASAAPLTPRMLADFKTAEDLDALQVELDWLSMGEYLQKLEKQGIALNVIPLIGHGTIREAVMGYENRRPNPQEMETMKRLLAQAMQEGAYGMSTGLIYAPSYYADTEELIELSQVVAQYGGLYCSHIRGEGDRLLDAVSEAITIGKKAGVAVQLSHHKAVGRANWGKVKHSLALIDQARAANLDVTADQYPYIAASNSLSASLPPWMHEGSKNELLKRLTDPQVRARLRQGMAVREGYWEDTKISYCPGHAEYEGLSLQEIAELRGADPYETTFDLLYEEEAGVQVVRFGMSEEDVRTVMRHPMVMVGSDASALAPYGVLFRGKPHPRNYGTFPRVLGKYAREEQVLSIEEAVRKMTSLPAQKLGLQDRGKIQAGMWADITIFNPQTVQDKATYLDPHQYPCGIEYVLVNGKPVIVQGEHTGELSGKTLIRKG